MKPELLALLTDEEREMWDVLVVTSTKRATLVHISQLPTTIAELRDRISLMETTAQHAANEAKW